MIVLCREMLKNLNDLVCSSVGDTCNGSWCAIMVDAVDKGSIGECDEVVGRKGGRVRIVGKFLHELEWRAVASDSADGMSRLASSEHAD